MKTLKINGVVFNDFGTNNYSNGMHLITAYPIDNMAQFVKDVLAGKYPGVFLNPSANCSHSTEFFGVWGTEEQYTVFAKQQRESQIASRIINYYGGVFFDDDFEKVKAEVEAAYKDWWL